MSLDKFLHDQKIVRAAMLFSLHVGYLDKANGEFDAARANTPCTANRSLECIDIRAGKLADGMCQRCRGLYGFKVKSKYVLTQFNHSKRALVKLCQRREREWPTVKKV